MVNSFALAQLQSESRFGFVARVFFRRGAFNIHLTSSHPFDIQSTRFPPPNHKHRKSLIRSIWICERESNYESLLLLLLLLSVWFLFTRLELGVSGCTTGGWVKLMFFRCIYECWIVDAHGTDIPWAMLSRYALSNLHFEYKLYSILLLLRSFGMLA